MAHYKIIATVHKVSEPEPLIPGEKPHVLMPCRFYEVGDRIVFEDLQINMAETTGAMCTFVMTSLMPVVSAMQRSVEPIIDEKTGEPASDSMQRIKWFSCPDAERPVIFKLERIPLKGKTGSMIAEDIVRENPGKPLHMHLPNPNDHTRGVENNLGEQLEEYGKPE